MKLERQIANFYVEQFLASTSLTRRNINSEILQDKMSRIWKHAHVKEYLEKDGLRAFMAIIKVPRIDTDKKKCDYLIYGFENAQGESWVKEKFLKYQHLLVKESMIETPSSHIQMSQFFCEHGFFVESVGTFGQVDKALKIIKEKYPNIQEEVNKLNLEVEPFVDPKDIPEMVQIWKDVFSENPEYFFCGSRKTFLAKHRQELLGKFQSYCSGESRNIHYLFKQNGKILGYCDTSIHNNVPWSKSNAGTQFCLRPELRGKRLGIYSYWLMLQDLSSVGVKTFSGNTSNPAVMKLAKTMKRTPTNYLMLKGEGFFEPQYFFDFVKSCKVDKI